MELPNVLQVSREALLRPPPTSPKKDSRRRPKRLGRVSCKCGSGNERSDDLVGQPDSSTNIPALGQFVEHEGRNICSRDPH